MGEISMNVAIHRAVRRDLDRFGVALDALHPGDITQGARIAHAWAQLDDQLTYHHHGEHEIAFPALAALGASDELITTMNDEHRAMADALDDARTAFAALSGRVDETSTAAARTALNQVRVTTVAHLDHEEAELEPVYQRNVESPEIKAMLKRFSRESGPVRAGRFFAWVTDGADNESMAAVRSNVPGPILTVIGGIFGRGYRRDIASLWADLGRPA